MYPTTMLTLFQNCFHLYTYNGRRFHFSSDNRSVNATWSWRMKMCDMLGRDDKTRLKENRTADHLQ